jgi:pimeloyl-ACP methyl ester carboxylesterase
VEYIYKNTKIFYEVFGEGSKLIVLLHGWGASSNLMMPLYTKLSSVNMNCKYLFIDFPPFGKSTEPIEPWSLKDYQTLTEEIIKEVSEKADNIIIMAHSFGGRVAIRLAGNKDFQIDKMLLFAPAGIKPKLSVKNKINILKYKYNKKIKIKKALTFGSTDYKILSPIMKKTFINVINEDLTQDCEKITAKSFIFFGDKDKETPLYMGKILKKKIPDSNLVVIKNGDHFAYIYYLDLIFPIIYSFLSGDN